MARRILLFVVVLVLFLLLIEVFNVLELKASIGRYASYWKQQASKNGEFTYIALGDSAAQGVGASSPSLGYVGLLAKQISAATGQSVRVINLSVSGAQTQDVISKQIPELKDYPKPDLLTLEIGANNVTHWNPELFATQYNHLAQLLPPGSVVSNVPYFGGRIRRNAEAIAASQIIDQAAARYHLKLVDLQDYTRKHQSVFNYSSDFFHPSNRGYRNWDAAFWTVIKPTLDLKK
jgi:acyl-CoA thioesterase-1